MLEINNLKKSFGKVDVLKGIDFSLKQGEISLLCGKNGAGKSTTFKCILGIIPFDGSIKIGGYSNNSLEAKRIIGYIPDEPQLYDELTIWEHIVFNAKLYKLEEWEDDARKYMESLELDAHKNKFGRECSHGMRQKLSIILGILHKPRLLIIDEPLVGLDILAVERFKELLIDMKNKGTTILLATHILASIEDICDNFLYLQDGKIQLEKDRKSLDGKKISEILKPVILYEEDN